MNTLTRPTDIELAETLADEIAAHLTEAVAARGRASLVVPGGSTPKLLFAALSCRPAPWDRVFVTLTDERWVSPRDPASNERQVRELLLQGLAGAAKFVGLKTTAPAAEEAVGDVEARLAVVPRPFDVVVLGMGEDGHFASLFPGVDGLSAALDPRAVARCVAIQPPTAPHERMSLTLAALASCRSLYLYATGPIKRAVIDRAQSREARPQDLPIAAVLRTCGDRLTLVRDGKP
jgi:6-phosphogluconolactonase